MAKGRKKKEEKLNTEVVEDRTTETPAEEETSAKEEEKPAEEAEKPAEEAEKPAEEEEKPAEKAEKPAEEAEEPAKEEKKSHIAPVVLCVTAFALCVFYAGVSIFYTGRFMPNTVINGIPVQNQSIAQVNNRLLKDVSDYELTLALSDNNQETINGTDFDYETDYTESLSSVLSTQRSYEWPWYLMNATSYQANPEVKYDEGKLLARLSDLSCFRQEEANSNAVVAIENRMNHFTLRDDRQPALNPTKATDKILTVLNDGGNICELTDAYDAPEATSMQEQVLKRFDAVDKIQKACVSYADGDLSLDADKYVTATWITVDANKQPVLDKDGKVVLDEEKVREFAEKVADVFNTDQKDRVWNKYQGGTVLLPSRNKGYIVDEDAEVSALMKTVANGWTEKRRPYYSQEGAGHGNGEVGDTYVEVDLGHQKLYYIQEGKLMLTSDIVTGCKRYHNDTPSMITNIYFMQQNRTLHGENYATFVYYWMAFYNHYGLHDATWRSKFGGDIYLTDGSHGCVNMPKENAAKLYEMVHVGTPVVLYE